MLPNQPPVWKILEALCWEDNNIVAKSKNAKKKGLSTVVLALWPFPDSHTEALSRLTSISQRHGIPEEDRGASLRTSARIGRT